MIVKDPDELRDIVKGRPVEVRLNGEPPAISSVHAVQSRAGKKATCHVLVIESWAHVDGGCVVIVERTERIVVEGPNFLGKSGGYTSRTDHAISAFDADGPEPEAVPKSVVKDFKKTADLRANQQAALDRATRERLSIGGQIDAMLAEAEARRIDVHDRRRRLQRELELLLRDLQAAA